MVDPNIPSIPAFQPRLKARLCVYDYVMQHFDEMIPGHTFAMVKNFDPDQDIFVVWFAKTLQNWKALCSTTIEDGRYYEVTYDGDKQVAYLDVYKKEANISYPEPIGA